MTIALLFPGQGVQHPDALRWLEDEPLAHAVLASMASRLGADWRARLADPAWATTNRVAQVLVTGLCLAAWRALAPRLPVPVAVAGYSVGELAACAAADVYDDDEALSLAQCRAAAMDRATEGAPGGMISVAGLDAAALDAACRRFGLGRAIDLGDGQWVLGGPQAAIAAAEPELAALGARATRLAVRIASHTPAMAGAALAFGEAVRAGAWRRARVPVVTNLDGRAEREPSALKDALSRQLAAPVQWSRCLGAIAERRPRCVLEVGPGRALSRKWLERQPGVPARSADEFQGADAVAEWVTAAQK